MARWRWTTSVRCEGSGVLRVRRRGAWHREYLLAHLARPPRAFPQAGGAAFGLCLVCLLVLLPAQYFMNLRRKDALEAEIHPRLPFLRSFVIPAALYAFASVLLLATWASYYGAVSQSFNAADLQRATLAVGNFRYNYFSVGPALIVIAWFFLVGALVLSIAFRNERSRTTAASDSAATYTGELAASVKTPRRRAQAGPACNALALLRWTSTKPLHHALGEPASIPPRLQLRSTAWRSTARRR
jgi:hypothetical protein